MLQNIKAKECNCQSQNQKMPIWIAKLETQKYWNAEVKKRRKWLKCWSQNFKENILWKCKKFKKFKIITSFGENIDEVKRSFSIKICKIKIICFEI